MVICHPHSQIFQKSGTSAAKVTVCINLYNYADYIIKTLESVYTQAIDVLDLIVVDDCSQDQSVAITRSWLEKKSKRFNNAQLVKHNNNSDGPSGSRNTAITLTQTPFIFMLDADNLIYPRCLIRCLETLEDSEASFTYPLIERFEAETGIMGNQIWNRDLLAYGNYIDTMALIRKTCLEAVGGYSYMLYGWEDFELWCKFAEKNYYGILVPEILARYRVHFDSFLQSQTNPKLKFVAEEMIQRHPWLKLQSAG